MLCSLRVYNYSKAINIKLLIVYNSLLLLVLILLYCIIIFQDLFNNHYWWIFFIRTNILSFSKLRELRIQIHNQFLHNLKLIVEYRDNEF